VASEKKRLLAPFAKIATDYPEQIEVYDNQQSWCEIAMQFLLADQLYHLPESRLCSRKVTFSVLNLLSGFRQ
jgi:hypothetical protein